jgi:hypothetical protein
MFKLRIGLKRWRVTKPIYALLICEAPFIIAGLALYGIADPNTYRSRLWQDGFDNGFNSSPAQPIYDLVNGGKMVVPLVWSQLLVSTPSLLPNANEANKHHQI